MQPAQNHLMPAWNSSAHCLRQCVCSSAPRLPPAAVRRPRPGWQQRHRWHQAVSGSVQHRGRGACVLPARLRLCVCVECGGRGRGCATDGELRYCRCAHTHTATLTRALRAHLQCFSTGRMNWLGLLAGKAALRCRKIPGMRSVVLGLCLQEYHRWVLILPPPPQTPPTGCPLHQTWPSATRLQPPSALPYLGRNSWMARLRGPAGNLCGKVCVCPADMRLNAAAAAAAVTKLLSFLPYSFPHGCVCCCI